jgi:C4-dicarboxylate-specific signal transduction histidine kinase
MAHDINNPLCGVLGNLAFAAEALGDPNPDLPEIRQALNEARDSARRVRDLIHDLNAFANGFGDGDGEGQADLAAAIAEAVDATRELTGQRCSVAIEVPDQARVAAPARRLAHVFTCIIRGAAQAMPERAPALHTIRIAARRSDPLRYLVEVTDDGPLIHPPGTPPPVEPFFGQPRVVRGSGAGLSAVMGMVRAVGGDVVAESAPGRGNVISVMLPVAGATGQAVVAPGVAQQWPRLGPSTTPTPGSLRS